MDNKNIQDKQFVHNKNRLIMEGYSEEEAINILKAMKEDRNIKRFTDVETIIIEKNKNNISS